MHDHHHHIDPESGDAKVVGAIIINMLLTLVQFGGGIFSGSLALIADAIHNLSDALALVIAFAARKIARRPATEQMTYGYGRAEIVAALINYTTLIVIGLYLVYEAVARFFNPVSIDGWFVVIIAGIAFVIDVLTALLTYTLSKTSMNIRAAFLHNVADALGSVAVILAGTLILLFDWTFVDPLVTLFIAVYILWMSVTEIGDVIRILMLASPPDIDTNSVLKRIRTVEGIEDIHHVHLWQMQEKENAMEAHLVIVPENWENANTIKNNVKNILRHEFSLSHTTFELECPTHGCTDSELIGHE